MKIMSAHQPDLFPYLGMFSKMKKSDYFDLAIYDQYTRGRYMDRVKIGQLTSLIWMNVPIVRKTNTPINEIELRPNWRELLVYQLDRQYKKNTKIFPFYKERFFVVEEVLDQQCHTLAEVGTASIISVKNFLGLKTLINILGENLPTGTEGLIELTKRYSEFYNEDICYLSGLGGKDYMDVELFTKHYHLAFNEYETVYKCSVLTPLFKVENLHELL